MNNKFAKVIIAFLLSVVIIVSVMPSINSYAAVSKATTDAAQQKKQAKKAYKYMIKKSKNEALPGVKISGSYKKSGKRYVFRIVWTADFSEEEMNYKIEHGEFVFNYEAYGNGLRSLSFYNKCKKKYKLYKPIVYVTLMTNDGYEVVVHKNGYFYR